VVAVVVLVEAVQKAMLLVSLVSIVSPVNLGSHVLTESDLIVLIVEAVKAVVVDVVRDVERDVVKVAELEEEDAAVIVPTNRLPISMIATSLHLREALF
jgi:hypothetical protein